MYEGVMYIYGDPIAIFALSILLSESSNGRHCCTGLYENDKIHMFGSLQYCCCCCIKLLGLRCNNMRIHAEMRLGCFFFPS